MMRKTKFYFFPIFSTFLIMLGLNHYRNDVSSEFEALSNIYKMRQISVVQINRIMAKHEIQKNLKNSVFGEKNYVREKYKRTRNIEDNILTYLKNKNEPLSELDAYMRCYYSRYAKKKGLAKLDCACEKKIFDIVDKIDKARKSYNKNLRKKTYFKYGLCVVATCLVPLLGIILPVLDRIDSTTKHILPIPVGYKQTGGRWFREYKSVLSASGIPAAVTYIYIAFFVILSFIILLLIIYVMGKVLKYEQLKEKKEKMFSNLYYDFNKDMYRKRFYYANI